MNGIKVDSRDVRLHFNYVEYYTKRILLLAIYFFFDLSEYLPMLSTQGI